MKAKRLLYAVTGILVVWTGFEAFSLHLWGSSVILFVSSNSSVPNFNCIVAGIYSLSVSRAKRLEISSVNISIS